MTEPNRYDCGMSLLSVQSQGFLWCLFLAIIVIVVVHGIKLAAIGYRTFGKKMPPEPPKEPEKKPEPVYFLVERKKKRSKGEFSEPRQINFQ